MLNRIKVKFPFADGQTPDTEAVVASFHRWIQEQATDGHLLLDVADYKHVANSYNILLVAHEADIILDSTDDVLGLAYVRKNSYQSSTIEAQISEVLSYASAFRDAFVRDLDVEFSGNIEVSFLDRSEAANTTDNQTAFANTLAPLLPDYGKLEPIYTDPRFALGFRASTQ